MHTIDVVHDNLDVDSEGSDVESAVKGKDADAAVETVVLGENDGEDGPADMADIDMPVAVDDPPGPGGLT